MKSICHRISNCALAGVALIVCACVPQTEVIKLFEITERPAAPYERLLVVSIAGDVGSRRRLEELIVAELKDGNMTGIASYQETGLKTELLQEEIDAAAKRAEADAILVTHIVSVDTELAVEPGRTDIVSVCRGGEPVDYFLYDHRELKEPDSVRIAHTVVAVTNLYAAAAGERIWTIQSTCFEKSSMDEVLRDEAKAIVRQLEIDRLVG